MKAHHRPSLVVSPESPSFRRCVTAILAALVLPLHTICGEPSSRRRIDEITVKQRTNFDADSWYYQRLLDRD